MADISTDLSSDKKMPFWRRQFVHRATVAQHVFDVLFGVVMPIVCLRLDPFGSGLFGSYTGAAHLSIATAMLALLTWLIARRPAGLLAGILSGGWIFAGGVGLLILPLSCMFAIVGIGLFGFVPLITAFVYYRNAVRAIEGSQVRMRWKFHVHFIVGLAAWIIFPFALHSVAERQVTCTLEMVMSDDPVEVERGVRLYWWLRLIDGTDHLVLAYAREQDETRKQRLATVYFELTGDHVEERLSILRD